MWPSITSLHFESHPEELVSALAHRLSRFFERRGIETLAIK